MAKIQKHADIKAEPGDEKAEEKANSKANARRREKYVSVTTGAGKGRPFKPVLDLANIREIPKLMIIGRGQLQGRAMHALRLRPELVENVKKVMAGPMYLIVEVALRRLIEDLAERQEPLMIRAEDLDGSL
jgi:hypothetical protein